jgi:uncharacterized protein YndB with AHSA1/START domain
MNRQRTVGHERPGGSTASSQRDMLRALGQVLLASPLFAFAPLYRRWHLRWGATDAEVVDTMPGDEILVEKASFDATRAITIDAPPQAVWPWLVQLGHGRAGWYSYDLFDNAARPSVDRVLPEYQQPAVGDWVPMAGTISDATAFKIKGLEPNRWMVWEKPDSTWTWKLISRDGGRGTRLVTRLRAHYPWRRSPGTALLSLILLEFGDFAMMRKLFYGVKRRAERLAAEKAGGADTGGAALRVTGARGGAVVENAIEIARSAERVFDYCVDLAHEPEWNPKAKRVERITGGVIGVGTRYEVEFLKGDPMTLEVVRFERPVRWETIARSSRLDAKGEGRIAATEHGAHLTMRMELRPKGPLRLLLPILGPFMRKQEERNLAAITAVLESRA